MKIRDLMAVDVATLDPDASLEEAARLMKERNAGSLPVTEGGRVVGVLTDRDIVVRALARGLSPDETAVGDIMTCELVSCREEDDAATARGLMAAHGVRRMLVVDGEGGLRGVVSLAHVAARQAQEPAAAGPL